MAVFASAAERMGLRVDVLDPDYRLLMRIHRGNQSAVLVGSGSPLNDHVAARICGDKYYTGLMLREAGFNVPTTVTCLKPKHFKMFDYSEQEGLEPGLAFAETHGYPVVVKPNRLSHGRFVQVVESREQLLAAIDAVWTRDYLALVQTPIAGYDLRLDYLDGTFLAGYSRAPSETRRADGFDILNLAQGASAIIVEAIPDPWLAMGQRIAEVMDVRHFGVDFRVTVEAPDVDTPIDQVLLASDPDQAHVIEVNASPLLGRIFVQGFVEQATRAQIRVLEAILAHKSRSEVG